MSQTSYLLDGSSFLTSSQRYSLVVSEIVRNNNYSIIDEMTTIEDKVVTDFVFTKYKMTIQSKLSLQMRAI